MQILLAEHAGACYGVQRALEMAHEAARAGGPAYTFGPLIHNPGVVADLEREGVFVTGDVSQVKRGTIIIRSHGITPDERDGIEARGLPVIDATCPHVLRAQKAAAELASSGCRVVVVGEQGHPEVEGLVAYARRAGAKVDVVSSADEVPADLRAPVGVVVQTTQRRANLEGVLAVLEGAGIHPQVKDTICSATRLRQDAAAALAGEVDAMVVIGGRNSSNTTRLAEICAGQCGRTFHVESASEIDPAWFVGCSAVGVTAGASTPGSQIAEAIARLEAM